jgi:phosphoglucosamine mutase
MRGLVSSSGFRGLAISEISPEFCMKVGLALSNILKGKYSVGHDVRITSPLLAQSLVSGLNAGGSDVIDLGMAPTPAVAFYSEGKTGGAMVTASHNPPEYNGIKLFDERGASKTQSFYLSLLSRLDAAAYSAWDSVGSTRSSEGLYKYLDHVISAATFKKMWKVGLDPGNGSTSITAPIALAQTGASVSTINLAPDGTFPARGSEPDESHTSGLSELVRRKRLDIGFAYDGDGDRLAVIDEHGKFVPQDIALAFAASRAVRDKPGSIVVVNVDTSAVVDTMVEEEGGRVLRSKVGDTYILEEMTMNGSVFGGETCGAWIYPKYAMCPDGVLSSIILMNLLDDSGLKPSEIGDGLPTLHLNRRKVMCPDHMKTALMHTLSNRVLEMYPGSEITSIDGIRVSMTNRSWILVRPSGTEPIVRITSEAPSESRSRELADSLSKTVEEIKEELTRKQ